MNFKKFKRLASAVLSFSMLLSMNAPVFATDMNTIAEAEKGNVSVLSELAARAGSATHKHADADGNQIDGTPVWSDWNVQEQPGCEKPGYKMRQCTVEFCYEVEVEEIDPLGHDYDEGEVQKPATCSQAGIKVVTCQRGASLHGSGSATAEVEIPQKPHNFADGTRESIAPTCKESGKTGTACAYGCGTIDETTVEVDPTQPATGHSYKAVDPSKVNTAADLDKLSSDEAAGITVTKATCTTEGSLVLECKNQKCDGTESEKRVEKTIAPSGHTYDKHINGKELDELTAAELQALTTSTPDGITVTKTASCTTPGSVTFKCKNSWDTAEAKTIEIPALGHDWNEGEVTKAPKCETPGIKTSTCQRCQMTDSVQIPATGHSYGTIDTENITNELLIQLKNDPDSTSKGITSSPATCTNKGVLQLICNKEDCDKTQGANVRKEISALGHDYDEGVFLEGEEATCEKDGQKTYTCKRSSCDGGLDADGHGKTYKVDVKASGHSYGTIDVNEEEKTVEASALAGLTTDETKGITIESGSCTTTGSLTLTCKNERCDHNNQPKVYTILSSEHSWVAKTYREMTCFNSEGKPQTGMVLNTCSVCGATEWVVIPVTHLYDKEGWFETAVSDTDYTVVVERTCTTDGIVNPICSLCKKSDAEITYPMTGHSYNAEDYNWPADAQANVADLEAAGITEAPSKAATCTSAGYQYYKCTNQGKCDATDVKAVTKHELPKASHDYADAATTKAATCTKPQVTAKFCQNPGCGEYDPEDPETVISGDPKGHSYEKKVQPTLEQVEEAGIEGITSVDDLSLKGDCVTDGYNYYICDDEACDKGAEYIKKIVTPARGSHDMQPNSTTIPATCQHPEQVRNTCSICGYDEVLDNQPGGLEPIQPHDYTVHVRDVVTADCTEGATRNGVAEYECKYGCGETQMIVIKPEHKWTQVTDDSEVQLEEDEYLDGDQTPYKAATCNAAGYQYEKCPVCKKVNKEVIPQLEHDYAEVAITEDQGEIGEAVSKASNCTENGYQYYRCVQPGCETTAEGHYQKRQLPLDKEVHDFQDDQEIPAGCVEAAKSGRLCTRCHAADPAGTPPTITGNALGHADEREGFNQGTEEDPMGDYSKLPVSTLLDLEAEGIAGPVSKAATCTKAGYEYHNCDKCPQGTTGHAIKVDIAPLDHEYEFTEIPSTCTQPGILLTKCKRCGDETRQEISSQPKLGHDFKEYPRQEATCVAEGKTAGWECSRCHESDTENLADHPKREVLPIDGTKHVWQKVESEENRDPDCVNGTTGIQVYVCEHHPDATRKAIVPPVHQWEAPVMQNCVNAGYTNMPGLLYHTCAICKNSEVMTTLTDCVQCDDPKHAEELKALQGEDPATSKFKFVVVKPTTLPAVEATCTTEGKTEGKTCSCGKVLQAQETLAMKQHEGELAVEKPGDCGHDGIKRHKCATCGTFYGDEVSFQPENSGKHTYVPHITDATCAEPMKIQEICSVCQHAKPAQEVVGTKLPHKFGSDGICTECGTPEIQVETKMSASSDSGNMVILTNELAVNNKDKFELVEAGIIYYTLQSLVNGADTPEKQEALLDFSAGNTSMKVAKVEDPNALATLRIYNKPVSVGPNVSFNIIARAYLKVKVDGKEVYRYGNIMKQCFNDLK